MIHRWAPERIAEVKAMRDGGMTGGDIARSLGLSRGIINNLLRRQNNPAVKLAQLWMPQEDITLRQMYYAGHPLSEIADRLGRTTKGVDHRLGALGVERRARPKTVRKTLVYAKVTAIALPPSRIVPGSTPVTLIERTGCCWPVGHDGLTLFCNEATDNTYCEHHRAIMVRPRVA